MGLWSNGKVEDFIRATLLHWIPMPGTCFQVRSYLLCILL